MGRNSADNEKLAAAARPGDLLLRLRDLPGPLALARKGAIWPLPVLESAAAHAASYAPKAMALGGAVAVRLVPDGVRGDLQITPARQEDAWGEPAWETVKAAVKAAARARTACAD